MMCMTIPASTYVLRATTYTTVKNTTLSVYTLSLYTMDTTVPLYTVMDTTSILCTTATAIYSLPLTTRPTVRKRG